MRDKALQKYRQTWWQLTADQIEDLTFEAAGVALRAAVQTLVAGQRVDARQAAAILCRLIETVHTDSGSAVMYIVGKVREWHNHDPHDSILRALTPAQSDRFLRVLARSAPHQEDSMLRKFGQLIAISHTCAVAGASPEAVARMQHAVVRRAADALQAKYVHVPGSSGHPVLDPLLELIPITSALRHLDEQCVAMLTPAVNGTIARHVSAFHARPLSQLAAGIASSGVALAAEASYALAAAVLRVTQSADDARPSSILHLLHLVKASGGGPLQSEDVVGAVAVAMEAKLQLMSPAELALVVDACSGVPSERLRALAQRATQAQRSQHAQRVAQTRAALARVAADTADTYVTGNGSSSQWYEGAAEIGDVAIGGTESSGGQWCDGASADAALANGAAMGGFAASSGHWHDGTAVSASAGSGVAAASTGGVQPQDDGTYIVPASNAAELVEQAVEQPIVSEQPAVAEQPVVTEQLQASEQSVPAPDAADQVSHSQAQNGAGVSAAPPATVSTDDAIAAPDSAVVPADLATAAESAAAERLDSEADTQDSADAAAVDEAAAVPAAASEPEAANGNRKGGPRKVVPKRANRSEWFESAGLSFTSSSRQSSAAPQADAKAPVDTQQTAWDAPYVVNSSQHADALHVKTL